MLEGELHGIGEEFGGDVMLKESRMQRKNATRIANEETLPK